MANPSFENLAHLSTTDSTGHVFQASSKRMTTLPAPTPVGPCLTSIARHFVRIIARTTMLQMNPTFDAIPLASQTQWIAMGNIWALCSIHSERYARYRKHVGLSMPLLTKMVRQDVGVDNSWSATRVLVYE